MHPPSAVEFTLRLVAAGLFGVFIGFEREWRQGEAGLHTTTLVATGASLFALLAFLLGAQNALPVIGGIVTGIGFLAGGVILRQGTTVTGLNSAATIWATAAVGALTGCGFFEYAAIASVDIVIFNFLLRPLVEILESRVLLYQTQYGETTYEISVTCDKAAEMSVRDDIRKAVATTKLNLRAISSAEHNNDVDLSARFVLRRRDDSLMESLAAAVGGPKASQTSWRIVDRSP